MTNSTLNGKTVAFLVAPEGIEQVELTEPWAAVEKAGQYAFRDRKRKKRTFRALWIQRINAAVRPFGMTYSVFINGLSKSGITVDRKVLSDLAIAEPAAFQAIAEKAKAALAA